MSLDAISLGTIKIGELLSEYEYSSVEDKHSGTILTRASFFSDTELLIVQKDYIILQVNDQEQQFFMKQNYKTDYQIVCRNFWHQNKHIIVVNRKQGSQPLEEAIVLLRSNDDIKKQLKSYFQEKNLGN